MVEQLDKFLNDIIKFVGFFLSERFINVFLQIVLFMYQQFQKELVGVYRINKLCGKCYFYFLISKIFVEVGKNNFKKKFSNKKKVVLMFVNVEEEFFYEKVIFKFNYLVQEESDICLGGKWFFDDVLMMFL